MAEILLHGDAWQPPFDTKTDSHLFSASDLVRGS